LNNGCGAEFVQKSKKLPRNFEENKSDCGVSNGYCIASFDGDADRLIYSFVDKSGNYHLIDGDKMTSIAALFVTEQLKILGIQDKLSLGVVQTGILIFFKD
jgi:phosphoacetylglucosamine mutase